MGKIEELKEEIERKKRELKELEESTKNTERSLAIKDLSEFTSEEKIKIFDKLYGSALSIVEQSEKDGYLNDDMPTYIYEEIMDVLARDRKIFWKYFNSLI